MPVSISGFTIVVRVIDADVLHRNGILVSDYVAFHRLMRVLAVLVAVFSCVIFMVPVPLDYRSSGNVLRP